MLKIKLLLSLSCLWSVSLFAQDNVPFRAEDTYKLELKMEFKSQKTSNVTTVKQGRLMIENAGPQLHINIKLNVLQLLDDDYKLRIKNKFGQLVLSSKLKTPDEFVINLGAIDDVKKGNTPRYFDILFINKAKETTSHITIEIKTDGTFMVNDEVFGKI